jgi:multidrug efflux pump
MSTSFMAEASTSPVLTNLESNLILDKPQIKVSIDRQRAADLGVGVDIIGRTMETLLGGRQVTRFNMNGEQYDVVLQVAGKDRNTPAGLQSIYLMGRNNATVQLSSLVSIEENVAPKELIRFNQLRSATITAIPAPGYSLGDALKVLEQAAAKVLPSRRCRSTIPARAASSSSRARASSSSSCWRWASSIWCWRRSSRASSIRS